MHKAVLIKPDKRYVIHPFPTLLGSTNIRVRWMTFLRSNVARFVWKVSIWLDADKKLPFTHTNTHKNNRKVMMKFWMLADMAHRTCSQNGTWFDAQYNRSDWSNYQNCTNLKEYEVKILTKLWGEAQTATRLVLDLFLWKYCEFRSRGVKKITSAPQGLKRSRFSWIERNNPLSSTIFFLLIF